MKVYAEENGELSHVGWADVDEMAAQLDVLVIQPYPHLGWITDDFIIVSIELAQSNGWTTHERVLVLRSWQNGDVLPGWRPRQQRCAGRTG